MGAGESIAYVISSQPASWEPAPRLPESFRRVVELSPQPQPAPWLPGSFHHILAQSSWEPAPRLPVSDVNISSCL